MPLCIKQRLYLLAATGWDQGNTMTKQTADLPVQMLEIWAARLSLARKRREALFDSDEHGMGLVREPGEL